MTMLAELRAVVLFCILLGLIAGGLLLGTWHGSGRTPGGAVGRPAFLAAWSGFCLLGALTAMLYAVREFTPPAVTVIVANAVLLLANALFWTGARWLRGAAVRPWMIGLAPAAWLAACAIPAFYGSPAARVATGGLLFTALEWAAAAELLRWRPAGALPETGRVLAGLAGLCGITHLARVALVVLDLADLSVALIALSTGMLMLATGIVGVALAGEQAAARVAAAGVPHLVTGALVRPGVAVLDVGITRTEAGLVGDVAPDVMDVAGFVAPMPGGVGPMTRAMLIMNVVEEAERQ